MPTRKTVVENAGLGDVTANAAQAPKNALRVTFIVALSAHRTGAIIALPGSSAPAAIGSISPERAAELWMTHEALYRALADLVRGGRVDAQERGKSLVLTIRSNMG